MTPRKLIRQAVATALTGATAAGTRVVPSRVYNKSRLPALAVYTPTDRREADAESMDSDARECTVLVEIRADANSELENTLDDISAEIMTALMSDRTLGGACDLLQFDEYESDISDEGEKPRGVGLLAFSAYYRVAWDDPNTKL